VIDLRHHLPLSLLKIVDIVIVICAFGLSTVLMVRAQGAVSLAMFLAMRTKISNFFLFILTLWLFHLVFRLGGIYRSRRLSTKRAELVEIVGVATISSVLLTAEAYLFSIRMLTPTFLLLFWAITSVALSLFRIVLRSGLAHIRAQGRNLRYLLILGTNSRAISFARKIIANPESGYRLLGFVDDEWGGTAEFNKSGFELACEYANLPEFMRRNVVDEAIVYLPYASFHRHWTEVASLCTNHGTTLRVDPDAFGLSVQRWHARELDGLLYFSTKTRAADQSALVIKRMIDIAVSGSLLVLMAPMLLLVALAIKLTSPGPALFLQERVGLNKRRFKIWKFRTMVVNAERLMTELESRNEVSGPVFKIKNDPRITGIGKFLRKSSIDELPQLVNVLKGDMSLVGPRPLPVRDYEGFNEDWQRRRFSVMPGITCLWQVHGRSSISFDQWMRLDLQYMDEWSLWLDLKILARTLPAVVRGSGAA
jgi:exopolysaccharide biosynthesis polyprenyl glycosylphosphotransferase